MERERNIRFGRAMERMLRHEAKAGGTAKGADMENRAAARRPAGPGTARDTMQGAAAPAAGNADGLRAMPDNDKTRR